MPTIRVLRVLDMVRKHRKIFLGDTSDGTGLHHMAFVALECAIDEARVGHCDRIAVSLHRDGSVTVSDNGRGLLAEVDPADRKGRTRLQLRLMGVFVPGGGGGYLGLPGVLASRAPTERDLDDERGWKLEIVNALSAWLRATIHRDGRAIEIAMRRGRPVRPLAVLAATDRRGMTIRFRPSPRFFPEACWSFDTLLEHVRRLPFLFTGPEVALIDERNGRSETVSFRKPRERRILRAPARGAHPTEVERA